MIYYNSWQSATWINEELLIAESHLVLIQSECSFSFCDKPFSFIFKVNVQYDYRTYAVFF